MSKPMQGPARSRVWTLLPVALALAAPALRAQAGGAGAPVVALRAARLLDVKTGRIDQNAVVVVTGTRITAAGPGAAIPAGARTIDLGDVTVLPGLIDAHTHLLQNYHADIGTDDPNMVLTVATLGTTRRVLLGAALARQDLEAGITTVRDLGNSGVDGDVALRDAIRDGWVPGPRIAASTRALSAAGGQFGWLAPEAQKLVENEYVVVATPDEARHAVQQAMYDGADLIKVIVNTGPRVVSLEAMKAIVEEAGRVRRKVAAHAIGDEATRIAADAGVASIEHGYVIPDDVLQTMAKKHIFLVPTDYPGSFYEALWRASGEPLSTAADSARMRKQIAQLTAGNRDRLQRAIKLGVPIAFGSDEYYDVPGMTRGQASVLPLRAYLQDGLTPLQVLQAATVNAAELLGWSDRIGTLEPGKLADIIAVPGNPLTDPRVLDRVGFVMKNGVVIKGP